MDPTPAPTADYRAADIRLLILETLRAQPRYTAHEHIIRTALDGHGHAISAAALRGHLAWLDELGLLILARRDVQVAVLTERGDDCAQGLSAVPGVARPRPE